MNCHMTMTSLEKLGNKRLVEIKRSTMHDEMTRANADKLLEVRGYYAYLAKLDALPNPNRI